MVGGTGFPAPAPFPLDLDDSALLMLRCALLRTGLCLSAPCASDADPRGQRAWLRRRQGTTLAATVCVRTGDGDDSDAAGRSQAAEAATCSRGGPGPCSPPAGTFSIAHDGAHVHHHLWKRLTRIS